MKHQSLIGLFVLLLSTPAFAHVVGVNHSLPPAPEYERILEGPVIPGPTDTSIAAIQKRRAARTDHLRVIQNVERNLFRPVVWETAHVETTALSFRSAISKKDELQDARDFRMGEQTTRYRALTLKDMLKERTTVFSCGGRPERVKKP